jgi:hypothetical protein
VAPERLGTHQSVPKGSNRRRWPECCHPAPVATRYSSRAAIVRLDVARGELPSSRRRPRRLSACRDANDLLPVKQSVAAGRAAVGDEDLGVLAFRPQANVGDPDAQRLLAVRGAHSETALRRRESPARPPATERSAMNALVGGPAAGPSPCTRAQADPPARAHPTHLDCGPTSVLQAGARRIRRVR